jgi:hypothetical protein
MAFKDWIGRVFGETGKGIIQGIGETADRFIQTKEERAEFQLALMKAEQEFKRLEMEAEQEYFKDRASAREMYMKDSTLQKIYALMFLVCYFLISAGMVAMVVIIAFYAKEIDLPEWGVMLLSSVFTAMSTKVATITDFLFGGSKSKDDSEKRIADAFERGTS